MIDGLAVLESRQRIERHFTTWINRQVAKWIGHDGQMPIEELAYSLMMLDGVIPDAPNPSVQVAQGNGFIWNESAIQDILYATWDKKKDSLARKHLSAHAYGLWARMDNQERGRYAQVYERAIAMVRSAKRRGNDTGIDQAIRMLRASAPRPQGPPIRADNGRTITQGLCYTCQDCLACYASRDGAERCNDYAPRGKIPARAGQTGVRASDRGRRTAHKDRPLLKTGI